MRALSRLCEFYPGICLTTEEKGRKNLSKGKKNLSQVKKNLSGNVDEALIFRKLTLAEKTEINNLGRAKSDSFISQSSTTRIQTFVRSFNTAVYAIRNWLSGCDERNALLDPFINHTIIISLITQ